MAVLLGIVLVGWLPACIGVNKLSTKLQKEKHFAFFSKTVLGEVTSPYTVVWNPEGIVTQREIILC